MQPLYFQVKLQACLAKEVNRRGPDVFVKVFSELSWSTVTWGTAAQRDHAEGWLVPTQECGVCVYTLSGFALRRPVNQCYQTPRQPTRVKWMPAPAPASERVCMKGAVISRSSELHQFHSLVTRNIECWCEAELRLGTLTKPLSLGQCALLSATVQSEMPLLWGTQGSVWWPNLSTALRFSNNSSSLFVLKFEYHIPCFIFFTVCVFFNFKVNYLL